MIDKEYMDADYEVISMVNKCHKHGPGSGGELPSHSIRFIPEERADTVLELDARIEKMRKVLPLIICGAIALFSFVLGTAF